MIPNSDITIYNRYIVNRVETWQRSQVHDVVWQSVKAVNGSKSGLLSSNTATVFIPFAKGTQYVLPKEWQALTNKSGKWTLIEGDILVSGLVADEITSGFTLTDLRAKYNEVVMITSVDAIDQGSFSGQHWEVGCK